MQVKYGKSRETLTLFVYGELDEYSSSNVREILDKVIYDNINVNRVVFDLSGLSFMDSTGVGLLIGRYKKIKEFNLPVYITGASPSTEKVIELAGLYKIMPKY